MNTTGKRLLALMTALLLCAGLLPAAALAGTTLDKPTLSKSYDSNYQQYTFSWTAPTGADRVEWELLYRETASAEAQEVRSGWIYADDTEPWYPTLSRDDMLNNYGPGQYTLRARASAYDYTNYCEVYSEWAELTVSVEGTRLAAPTDVVFAPDGTVSWAMDESEMVPNSYFTVKVFCVEQNYAQMQANVYPATNRVADGEFRYRVSVLDYAPGATYYALVQHCDNGESSPRPGSSIVQSGSIVTAAADSALPAPENLRWDTAQQALRWDAVEGANSYVVFFGWDNGSYGYLSTSPDNRVETTSFRLPQYLYQQYEDVPTTFWFAVRAESADLTQRLNSPYDHKYSYDWNSNTDNRDELYHATVTLTRPAAAAPTGFRVVPTTSANPTGDVAFEASWTPVAGAGYYEIRNSYRADSSADWETVSSSNRSPEDNPTTLEWTPLMHGPGTYRFEIRTVPSDSAYSSSAWAVCDWTYDAATIAAPTGLRWDGDTSTLSFTPSPEAARHVVRVYQQYSEDSQPWCCATAVVSGTSWQFFPTADAYYSFSVVAMGDSLLTTAPAEALLPQLYYLNAIRVGRPTGLRLDSGAAALCWNAVAGADWYNVTVRHLPSGQSWTFNYYDQTSLSLGVLATAAGGFSDGDPLSVTVQAVKQLRAYETVTGDMASNVVPWSASLLDKLKDANGLIPLAADYDLRWGVDFDYRTQEEREVPGLLSLRFGRPTQGNAKYCIRRASDDSLLKEYYYSFTVDLYAHSPECADGFLADCFDTTTFYLNGQPVTVEPFPEGDYYFTAQQTGDGIVYSDGPIVRSDVWHYTPAPAGSALAAPTITSFQMEPRQYNNPNGDLTALTVRWSSSEAAKTYEYEVAHYFTPDPLQTEPKNIGYTRYRSDNANQSATVSDYMIRRYGDGVYYVAVRAISADVTQWRNSPFGAMAKFDTRDATEVASGALESLTEAISPSATAQEVRQEVQDTVKTMGTDVLELAMLADQNGETGGAGILEMLSQLEEKAGGPAESKVDTNASNKVKDSFPTQRVSVIGATLNAPADSAEPVELVIGSPKSEDVIPELYDQTLSVKFSMELTGVADSHTLAVPVQVTLPLPDTVNPIFLHILHYKADGSHEEVAPVIFVEDGQAYAQFVLSSLSDFAIMVDRSAAIWDAESETGTLSVEFRLETPYSAAGWALLCAYGKGGQMIGAELSPVDAGASEGFVCLTDAALKPNAFTAKLFFLGGNFAPIAAVRAYPTE